MKRFFILFTLLCCHQLMAASGIVRTTDSNSISGEIRFIAGGVTVSNVAKQTTVALTNLLRLDFASSATPNTRGKGTGLLGLYFGETNLSGPAYLRLDEHVDFSWGPKDKPVRQVDSDYFSVTWAGELEVRDRR